MKRLVFAALAGGLFGAGLMLSGMTDTARVQGFLDIFGAWNPTLAFVMGGAILPMTLAWVLADRRKVSALGTPFPSLRRGIDRSLVLGSILFGIGWGLVGLCPGPALAVVSFAGPGGLVFLLAMGAGMVLAPQATRLTNRLASQRLQMDIRRLTDSYAVSPQIAVEDLQAIKAAGFTTVIDNRPDGEIPPDLHTPVMQAAAEALGLTFVVNPVIGGGLTMENVTLQRQAMEAATGPVFAYCASGNRCSVVWALSQAGKMPVDDLVGIPARFGYQLDHLRPQLYALAGDRI
jgi:uncharacterized protein (TIGR01244 family)